MPYEEDVHEGTHLEVWGSWYDKETGAWGFACCKGTKRKVRQCPLNAPADGQGVPDDDGTEYRVSARVAELLERCPTFTGEVPTPDIEKAWSSAELKNYFFSNGLIRPSQRRGDREEQKVKVKPSAEHYKILDLEEGAKASEIKKAFRRLALIHHPDKVQDEKKKASAAQKFQDMAAAYEVIMGSVAEVPPPDEAGVPEAEGRRKFRKVVIVQE